VAAGLTAVTDLRFLPRDAFDRVRDADGDRDTRLAVLADMCRLNALVAVKRAGSGHLGSTFSSLDIVVHLLFEELDTAVRGFDSPDRDVFFSSKGHDVPGLYAALHALGALPASTGTRTSAYPASRRTPARSGWASRRGAASPGPSAAWATRGASW
jgi:hypothetical protein